MAVLVFTAYGTAWVVHIGEYHAGSAKYVVFKSDVVVDRDIVLYFAIVADHDAVADEHVLTK